MKRTNTITALILEYFKAHANEELDHGPVVDWVTEQWKINNSTSPRDPWRAIRTLYQKGILIKVREGVYKYDPKKIKHNELLYFDEKTKHAILERDNYKCLVCGKSAADGITLVVDHIRPIDQGGTNDIDNGETLCSQHNLMKKNYSHREMLKKYVIIIYNNALKTNDDNMICFCKAIFDIYDRFGINGHIDRPDK